MPCLACSWAVKNKTPANCQSTNQTHLLPACLPGCLACLPSALSYCGCSFIHCLTTLPFMFVSSVPDDDADNSRSNCCLRAAEGRAEGEVCKFKCALMKIVCCHLLAALLAFKLKYQLLLLLQLLLSLFLLLLQCHHLLVFRAICRLVAAPSTKPKTHSL